MIEFPEPLQPLPSRDGFESGCTRVSDPAVQAARATTRAARRMREVRMVNDS
ncbi:MAG TPA: hypothetical protein VFQ76_20800 [Longimicrobiaceae bacterium]|nr:hypothetical protein [Longimicrobiaceae bacterium]